MPARGRGGKSEGAKKHHASSRRSFFSDAFRGRGGNLEVTKKHHAFSGGRRYRGFATLPPLAINTDPPIFSHEHTIFRDAVFPDVRARTWWEIGGLAGVGVSEFGCPDWCETSIGGLLRRNEHTIFRDAIFPGACRADVVGNRRGQKNTTLRGCLTEKIADKNRRTLLHEHTIFRDAIFPDACARRWWEIGGGKKNTTHFQMELFQVPADVVGNRRGKKHPA
jgi:hypothetical protein